MSPVLRALVATFALLVSSQLFAFGATAHTIVSQVAEDQLDPLALEKIRQITKGEHLQEIAFWADEIRADKKNWDYTKYWHFISIDDDQSFEDVPRIKEGDILEALDRFENQLREHSGTEEERWQALAFYVHFVTDIHQPIHIGRWDDHGGNRIEVSWFGQATNLHSIWDDGLIDINGLSSSEIFTFIEEVSAEQKSAWRSSTYLDYAKESKSLRSQIYDFGPQVESAEVPSLNQAYADLHKETMKKRLAQASIRLAAQLNDIFSEN